ncbi:hypothetical protein ACFPRL_05535 [Pseudoclavibacter helvolus]
MARQRVGDRVPHPVRERMQRPESKHRDGDGHVHGGAWLGHFAVKNTPADQHAVDRVPGPSDQLPNDALALRELKLRLHRGERDLAASACIHRDTAEHRLQPGTTRRWCRRRLSFDEVVGRSCDPFESSQRALALWVLLDGRVVGLAARVKVLRELRQRVARGADRRLDFFAHAHSSMPRRSASLARERAPRTVDVFVSSCSAISA